MKEGKQAAIITTAIGELYEHELDVEMVPQASGDDVWVVARECRYNGNDPVKLDLIRQFMEATGRPNVIRRDVWVTIKRGQAAQAEKGN